MLEQLQSLVKALELGGYNAAPGSLVQGSSLQTEDLSPVMNNLCFQDKHIKLQKMLAVKSAKGQLVQFNRQLSYGQFGGSAQLEGAVGQEDTGDYVRSVVPMAYYSQYRRVTLAANMASPFDGVKGEDREADNAAKVIAGDIEFDLFRGKDDFSNAGVFDGHPALMASIPNMMGLFAQVRQSDVFSNTQDLMFAEYGSDQSVALQANGTLSQSIIEDANVRSAMNMGEADRMLVDPLVLAAYNKIAFGKERIMLAGSPQDATGADLRRQWVAGGVMNVEASRFLSGKTRPGRAKSAGPVAPSIAVAQAASTTSFLVTEVYKYTVTSVNEIGESVESAESSITIGVAGNQVNITITPSGSVKYFNVYRTVAGGKIRKFIGRVVNSGAATTVFNDLNNKIPGFVTGIAIDGRAQGIHELMPYTRLKLAVTSLSLPEAHARFVCLAAYAPRFNVLIDNLRGDI